MLTSLESCMIFWRRMNRKHRSGLVVCALLLVAVVEGDVVVPGAIVLILAAGISEITKGVAEIEAAEEVVNEVPVLVVVVVVDTEVDMVVGAADMEDTAEEELDLVAAEETPGSFRAGQYCHLAHMTTLHY